MKDKLFILVTIILLILFAVSVTENMSFTTVKPLVSLQEKDVAITHEILTRFEKAGLELREAEYYQVMDE